VTFATVSAEEVTVVPALAENNASASSGGPDSIILALIVVCAIILLVIMLGWHYARNQKVDSAEIQNNAVMNSAYTPSHPPQAHAIGGSLEQTQNITPGYSYGYANPVFSPSPLRATPISPSRVSPWSWAPNNTADPTGIVHLDQTVSGLRSTTLLSPRAAEMKRKVLTFYKAVGDTAAANRVHSGHDDGVFANFTTKKGVADFNAGLRAKYGRDLQSVDDMTVISGMADAPLSPLSSLSKGHPTDGLYTESLGNRYTPSTGKAIKLGQVGSDGILETGL